MRCGWVSALVVGLAVVTTPVTSVAQAPAGGAAELVVLESEAQAGGPAGGVCRPIPHVVLRAFCDVAVLFVGSEAAAVLVDRLMADGVEEEARAVALEAEVQQIVQVMADVVDLARAMQVDLGVVRSDVGVIQAELGQVQGDVGRVQTAVGQVQADVGRVQTDVARVDTSIVNVNQRLNLLDTRLTDLQREVREGRGEIEGEIRALRAEFVGRHEELLGALEQVQDEIRRRLSARE